MKIYPAPNIRAIRVDYTKALREEDDGIIPEFKVHDPGEESSLKDTEDAALTQIEEKAYAGAWRTKGFRRNASA